MIPLTFRTICLVTCLSAAPIMAQEDAQSQAEAETAGKLAQDEIAHWEFTLGREGDVKVALDSKPVLRWSNPGAGRVYGDIFIGTSNGRPEVIASVYKWFDPFTTLDTELHSLSSGPIQLRRDGELVWDVQEPGLRMKDLSDASGPSESVVGRLREMRQIARGFSGYLVDRRGNPDGEDQLLRLLPQPIHRYESSDPNLIDGALFAFVLGTDPEIVLALEARRIEGRVRWQYGFVRMNSDELWMTRGGERIWEVPALPVRDDNTRAYYQMTPPQPQEEAGVGSAERVIVVTTDGEVHEGLLLSKTKEAVEVQTDAGRVRIATEDVDEIRAVYIGK